MTETPREPSQALIEAQLSAISCLTDGPDPIEETL